MTLFEYISIATSLMLSFSLARILTNLAPVFSSENRYWVHSAWVVLLLFNHVSLFWQLWLFQGAENWTLVAFMLLLVGPTMLLIGASLLVPVGAVSNYRDYFESIRGPFYFFLIFMQLHQIPLLFMLFDIPLLHPVHLTSFFFASAFVVGLVGRRRTIDLVLICIFIPAVIGGLFFTNDHEVTRELMQSLGG